MLSIAKFDRFDIVNNPGEDKPSMTIWFTGCSMGCEDCHSPSLVDRKAGREYKPQTVFMAVDTQCVIHDIHTVVLLGGEPLDQDHDDLKLLCKKLHENHYKIWLYTGWEFENIPASILQYLAVVKCGRYDKTLATGGFPSSSNQRVMRKLLIDNTWQQEVMSDAN